MTPFTIWALWSLGATALLTAFRKKVSVQAFLVSIMVIALSSFLGFLFILGHAVERGAQ